MRAGLNKCSNVPTPAPFLNTKLGIMQLYFMCVFVGGVCCLKSWNEDYEPVGENKWGEYNLRYQTKQICICRKIIMKKAISSSVFRQLYIIKHIY